MGCIMKFIKIQTNWVNWVKHWSHRLKKSEEVQMTQQIQKETRMDKVKEDSTDCNCGF